jgi:hypothetical protein
MLVFKQLFTFFKACCFIGPWQRNPGAAFYMILQGEIKTNLRLLNTVFIYYYHYYYFVPVI